MESLWEQMADLTVRRTKEALFVERQVRGESWTFVHNNITGEHLRINALARTVIHSLDGIQSLREIVQSVLGEDSKPDIDESINVASQSRRADKVKNGDIDALQESLAQALLALSQFGAVRFCDAAEHERLMKLSERRQANSARRWHNPLAVKFPLHDPDRWVNVLQRRLAPWLTVRLLVSMVAVIVCAALLAITRSGQISVAVSQLASTPTHWWQMLVIYPLLKCLHELAHALCIKHFGGEVHEVGITLLVLMPIPYVDASDTWRFEQRSQRILVSASGMLVEGFMAACAFLVWCVVEAGFISNLMFAIAILGSVSSVLFNANPLLKFDGYQILQDWLDIPNLASRSSRYLSYLARRYLLLVAHANSPVTATGERRWLVVYGISALAYRWFITFVIALYLASWIPFAGIALALFAIYQLTLKPLLKMLKYLSSSNELADQRSRSVAITATLTAVSLSVLFMLPVPTNTRAQGIVWSAHQVEVYSPEAAQISQIHVASGEAVESGQVIVTLHAPELNTRLISSESELQSLTLTRQSLQRNDLTGARALSQDINELTEEIEDMRQRISTLSVRASRDGQMQWLDEHASVGRYVGAGDTLANVIDDTSIVVKTVISQSDISRLEDGVDVVRVRLAESFDNPVEGQLLRHIPAGNRTLPSSSLAYNGRSGIAVASVDDTHWQTVEPVFHVEVGLPNLATVGIGGKAYVRFAHAPEPIGKRSIRALRQLLLRQLAI